MVAENEKKEAEESGTAASADLDLTKIKITLGELSLDELEALSPPLRDFFLKTVRYYIAEFRKDGGSFKSIAELSELVCVETSLKKRAKAFDHGQARRMIEKLENERLQQVSDEELLIFYKCICRLSIGYFPPNHETCAHSTEKRELKQSIYRRESYKDLLLKHTSLDSTEMSEKVADDITIAAFKIGCWFTEAAITNCTDLSQEECQMRISSLSSRLRPILLRPNCRLNIPRPIDENR